MRPSALSSAPYKSFTRAADARNNVDPALMQHVLTGGRERLSDDDS